MVSVRMSTNLATSHVNEDDMSVTADPYVGSWRPHRRRGPIAALYSGPGPKYALPGVTGHSLHDPTKFKNPAYSFGARHAHFKEDTSPGPCYLVPSALTRTGRAGTPHYSLYGRPREPGLFKTPGPGSYSPERAGTAAFRSAPSYSLTARTDSFHRDQTPGPAKYMLPAMLGPHVINKSSAPTYSLSSRGKIGSFHEDLQKTPGPGTYHMVESNTYRNKPPQYSLTARNSLPGDTTRKPGPGAYSPEKVTLTHLQAPGYSFGLRHSEYVAPLIIHTEE
ncbi:ciliary microtubule associated protein 1A-like isoform X3 [Petromyzon marinus]|uniref:ciliary microtubule associated protein 1A-like isoform X3 n=1 Tax=Petromyzon marinus TaxID=7757 RepID=UPI003F71F758